MKSLPDLVTVRIHASQFPENVRRDLLASLHTRRVNHKFHYDSVKQTQKWLALHEAHSPARYDKNCLATYDEAFIATAEKIKAKSVHVLGLGCGGGQKDVSLLKQLATRRKKISYTPCDVSTAMVLVAQQAARKVLPVKNCFPFVCDLATAKDLPAIFNSRLTPHASRLVTFFGMIPNFEPRQILPKLAELLRPNDSLLFSANLAPGADYAAGMKHILPQYDNPLTRDWLTAFLFDLGVEARDGELRFSIERGGLGLQRFVAKFHFRRTRQISVSGEEFSFARGEAIQLFFSYRYTPERVRKILARHGLAVGEQWITQSGEEGVFLCQRG
jgi:L-histidine Nalpha-methyltransferase